MEQTESKDESNEQDDDYYSVEAVDIDEEEEDDQTNHEMNPDATGAASSTNEETPDGLDETPKENGPGDTSSIHSRENEQESSTAEDI